jgi:hypothetical protein
MAAPKLLVDMISGVKQAGGRGVVSGPGVDMAVDVNDGDGSRQ